MQKQPGHAAQPDVLNRFEAYSVNKNLRAWRGSRTWVWDRKVVFISEGMFALDYRLP